MKMPSFSVILLKTLASKFLLLSTLIKHALPENIWTLCLTEYL